MIEQTVHQSPEEVCELPDHGPVKSNSDMLALDEIVLKDLLPAQIGQAGAYTKRRANQELSTGGAGLERYRRNKSEEVSEGTVCCSDNHVIV